MADFLRSSNRDDGSGELETRPASPAWSRPANEILDPAAASLIRDPYARLRSIVEHAPDGILTLDSSDLVTSCNTTLCRMLGYSLRDVLGNKVRHYIQPAQPHSAAQWLQASDTPRLGRYPSSRYAGEGLRSDGSYFPVEISVTQIDEDGALERLCIIRDASEHQATVAKLQAELCRARQSAQARNEYLAQMSHEIRTPMNGILGMTGLVLDSNLNGEQREFLEIAQDAARSLLDIVNDVLDFSRIEAGGVTLYPKPTNLRLLVSNTLSSLSALAQEKGLTIRSYIHDEVPAIVTLDAIRLRQILTNLLGNAIKFTTVGTCTVEVSCRAISPDQVRLHFRVSDTGCGIQAEALPTLFDQFTQVHSPGVDHPGGTGLGLAISRMLVDLMGGMLEVESAPEKGSTFYFSTASVPIERAGDLAPDAPRETPRIQLPAQRILLVEDDRVNELVTTNHLRRGGHTVLAVNTGHAALAALRANPVDVVLMDVNLPGIDGIETLRLIRQGKGGTEAITLPVIALTACATEGDRDRLLGVGMNDYVVKPVDPQALLQTIAEVVRDTGGPVDHTPLPVTAPSRHAQRRFLCSSQAYLAGIQRFLSLHQDDTVKCDDLEALRTLAQEVQADHVVRAVTRIESALLHGRYRRIHGLSAELAEAVKHCQQRLRAPSRPSTS